MSEENESRERARDDALVEALRDAYRPDELPELRRARIRARVRTRVADPSSRDESARRTGWGLVPAAAALAGVLIAIFGLLTSTRPRPSGDAPTREDVSAAALLLGDDLLLADGAMDDREVLPADYQALAALLERRT